MKVLLVDDSALMRSILKQIFQSADDIEVAGEASNGQKAVELVKEVSPDLVIMDINMPILNGIQATEIIMRETPVPILIFSNEVEASLSFKALNAGAVDTMKKPELDAFNDADFSRDFHSRLVKIARSFKYKQDKRASSAADHKIKAIVIGASTGGPVAVRDILAKLPGNFPTGIALVQHIEDNFDKSYADWLNTETELDVALAMDGEKLLPGTVRVAPAGYHLVIDSNLVLHLQDSPKILNQRPSVDALFTSAAESLEYSVLGVLLTGMGTDGAEGCVRIKEKGGVTLVQDESTSTIFGMPKAAITRSGASVVLPVFEIADYIIRHIIK